MTRRCPACSARRPASSRRHPRRWSADTCCRCRRTGLPRSRSGPGSAPRRASRYIWSAGSCWAHAAGGDSAGIVVRKRKPEGAEASDPRARARQRGLCVPQAGPRRAIAGAPGRPGRAPPAGDATPPGLAWASANTGPSQVRSGTGTDRPGFRGVGGLRVQWTHRAWRRGQGRDNERQTCHAPYRRMADPPESRSGDGFGDDFAPNRRRSDRGPGSFRGVQRRDLGQHQLEILEQLPGSGVGHPLRIEQQPGVAEQVLRLGENSVAAGRVPNSVRKVSTWLK